MGEDSKEMKIRVELPELLNTALEQPAKTMGSKISDLLEIIFGGISYKKQELTLKRERNFELFKAQLALEINKIPISNRIDPDESIIGPALEAAKYRIEHKEIREMFAKLLASSTDKTKTSIIHPSFVEIIKNLSSDDAKAFELISETRNTHLLSIVCISESVLIVPNKGRYYSWLSDKFGFENSNVILTSLLRNGLIVISNSFPKEIKELGFSFEKLEDALVDATHINRSDTSIEHGFISLSPLGLNFAEVCSPDSISDWLDTLTDTLEEMKKKNIGDTEQIERLLKHFNRL